MQEKEHNVLGIALIDQFAMAALPALVSDDDEGVYEDSEIAVRAYEIAEAMMTHRMKRSDSRYGKKRQP